MVVTDHSYVQSSAGCEVHFQIVNKNASSASKIYASKYQSLNKIQYYDIQYRNLFSFKTS